MRLECRRSIKIERKLEGVLYVSFQRPHEQTERVRKLSILISKHGRVCSFKPFRLTPRTPGWAITSFAFCVSKSCQAASKGSQLRGWSPIDDYLAIQGGLEKQRVCGANGDFLVIDGGGPTLTNAPSSLGAPYLFCRLPCRRRKRRGKSPPAVAVCFHKYLGTCLSSDFHSF